MVKTGLVLAILIALSLPVSWVLAAIANTRSEGVRIPVRVERDEPLRSIKVRIRSR